MVLSDLYRRYAGGPDHPMKGRLLGYLERLIPRSGIEADTVQGIRMRLDPWRSWERHLLRGGTYHPSLNRFIETNLRSGDIVAIAGISFGQQIIIASRCVGSNGIIIGIDPHPAALSRCRDNVLLNSIPANVRLVAAALGERTALAPLRAEIGDHVGEASLIKESGTLPFHVPVITLSDALRFLGVSRLDGLILDVIGYELPVLAGIEERYRPRIITLVGHQWVANQLGLSLKDYQAALHAIGYATHAMDGTDPAQFSDLRECQLVAHRGATPHWLVRDPSIPGGVWA
jgi:FkbM family methyltransferase